MQIQGPAKTLQVHGPHDVNGPHSRSAAPSKGQSTQAADQLDISPAAQEAARLAEAAETRAADGPIRSDVVARIKAEIADGSYETPEKLDAALDRLLDQIG